MQAEITMPCVAVASPRQNQARPVEEKQYHGDGRDILLQGFHWGSHAGFVEGARRTKKNWYTIMQENAAVIKAAGFSWVWFPPSSDSLAPEGYMPRRWNRFDTAFGTEDELRGAIRALEPVKAMADVIVNHRVGAHTSGADFEDPPFPNNRAAVTRDDSSGVGTGNLDTGESNAAGRDLDHTNSEVRTAIKSYLGRLKGVGFKGWRYDLVKGFHGRFIGEYNDATAPDFSVGEFYDGDRQKVTAWIDSTGGKSTAFDFPLRYLLHAACTNDDYSQLRTRNHGREAPGGCIGFWPSRAVTFLDNHDTEYCRQEQHRYESNDTCHFSGKIVDMGYAYLLTHPGIPCVFWTHFFDWGSTTRQRIETLINIRKRAGILAHSQVDIKESREGLYAAIIDGKVAVKLGSRPWFPGDGWQLALYGEKFAVWTRNDQASKHLLEGSACSRVGENYENSRTGIASPWSASPMP
jgi:alpha-amylase